MASDPFVGAPTIGAVVGGDALDGTDGTVWIRAGHIVAEPDPAHADARLDADGCVVAPGFIDVQVNGGDGVDFTIEPDRLEEVARRLPPTGVTSFLPTIISAPCGTVERACAAMLGYVREPVAARPLGLHLEGPYLSPRKLGAHEQVNVRVPDLAELDGWAKTGVVAMVTIAPELPGAIEAVELLRRQGIVACAGHSEADVATFERAVAVGLAGVTHLFNAMSPIDHRRPSMVVGALTDRSVLAGLIVDGVHVDPHVVRLAWACTSGRIVLVTDAMAAARMGDGEFSLGTVPIRVDGMEARTSDGSLAGSVLSMDQAVRNLVDTTGCDLAAALRCASAYPAELLGRHDLGHLRPGALADLVLIDADLTVAATVIAGRVVYDRDGRYNR
jgi:N-acetylglucosamine-6-phosphate deacetylase